ncbi:MAG: FtsX-like permease family protein [Phycisphaerae bacterium]|jgi:ABC-type antimicrobial peptide transport system permease subunit|nr:FtsX-like permease family protein [Phycisphaerae bacterium]
MKFIDLIARSLWFYRRTHLGVIGAAAIATAVLTGALLVGDSVSGTLHKTARLRLGGTSVAMTTGDNFFRARLGDELAKELKTRVATAIQLPSVAEHGEDSKRRAGNVNVLGVTAAFWKLSPARGAGTPDLKDAQVAINEPLAARMGVKSGEQILLTISKPSLVSRDAPLSRTSDAAVTVRLDVVAVIKPEQFGRFSLRADQAAPLNAFLPMGWLAEKLDLTGKANLLLVGESNGRPVTGEQANEALTKTWKLADTGVEVLPPHQPTRQATKDSPPDPNEAVGRYRQSVEVRSNRIFLHPAVVEATKTLAPQTPSEGILTYFVNELRVADRTTPYSIVTARGPLVGTGQPLGDGEVIINRWLADDLSAAPGDTLTMKYYVFGPMRQLTQNTAGFKIAKIIPNDSKLLDRDLMPDFPGLSQAATCGAWKPGIKIDQAQIQDEDRAYWKKYRGTPKAIISLAGGRKLWSNRFGDLTAIRQSQQTADIYKAAIRQKLTPGEVGLIFSDVAGQAEAAASEALDFGQLFLGLSMFLVGAAVLLSAMVFALGVRQRTGELGLLLAVGFTQKRVRRLVVTEGAILALIAVAIGLPGGVLYTHMVLGGLTTIWRGAVASAPIDFHASWVTMAIGAVASFAVSMVAILIVLRRQFRREVRSLLDNISATPPTRRARGLLGTPSFLTALGCILAGGACLATIGSQAGGFFAAGFLLLVALLSACRTWLGRTGLKRSPSGMSLTDIALRGAGRRPGRSLGVIAIIACGVFMVVAVGANQVSPLDNPADKKSGTGGFAVFGETSLPVFGDLNTPSGREPFGLDEKPWHGASVVHMRLRDGDQANCLNLNRAQSPRIIGVESEDLDGRFTFIETQNPPGKTNPWKLLDADFGPDIVPAISDEATVRWALGKSVGQSLEFVDERGRKFKVQIVAKIANSIFQGSLLISRKHFTERYVSSAGHRVFLADVMVGKTAPLAEQLNRSMSDVGMEATAAIDRLAEFNTVQSTYMAMFQVLGSLGLVLGTVGLALVVVRNIMERRGELAVLWAVGFENSAIRRMLLTEHVGLLVMGIFCGLGAAILAAGPVIRSAGGQLPYASLGATVLGMLVLGMLWIALAGLLALRGERLGALRSE